MKTRLRIACGMVAVVLAFGQVCLAQDAGEDERGIGALAGPSFREIVLNGGTTNGTIWLMIFGTSFATVWFIVDGLIRVRREKLLPSEVVDGVRAALTEGDLDAAWQTCEANPSPLSTILIGGFTNITQGYDLIREAVVSTGEMVNERIMQRVNYLHLCGQIAPMLGLMGTVTGMVAAFRTLAGTAGATRAPLLAQAISTALWTTCVGLMISVPALLAYTLIRNLATSLILEGEVTVLDLIKVLYDAELEEDGSD